MSVTIGEWTFQYADYDAGGDVLYLRLEKPVRVVCDETPEGHVLCYSEGNGAFVGVDLIGARHILERSGKLEVSLPHREDATQAARSLMAA